MTGIIVMPLHITAGVSKLEKTLYNASRPVLA